MGEVRYLYGAAVQGIQSFIFQTNKLREIVGASELVEEICTSKFKEIVGNGYAEYDEASGYGSVLHAAGNIKYIFKDKTSCENTVREFPKAIFEFAPGITVSQAVVEMSGEYCDFKTAVNKLEKRLRTQRNKPMRSSTLGLMGIERSRQTGLPVTFVKPETRFGKKEELHLDEGTKAKLYADPSGERLKTTKKLCEKAFGISIKDHDDRIAYNIEDITEKNDWVAIIHADGNGLGQVVQKVGVDPSRFKDFSEKLDAATTKSAIEAYNYVKKEHNLKDDELIPIRPIVLGGDDLTVICRADLALDFVTTFISQFEKNTREMLKDDNGGLLLKDVFENETDKRLTACAGIAYIKSSFPFYYGYNLAETLCSLAKKDAKDKQEIKDGKELPKSYLMFHKVQDSFTEDWNAIAQRELTPQPNVSFQFGPYYIKDKKEDSRWSVDELKGCVKNLDGKEGNAVKSHLRQWMSLLHDNPEMAKQKLLRLKSMTTNKELLNLIEKVTFEYKDKNESYKSPVYDILAIHTINNQMTKEVEQ